MPDRTPLQAGVIGVGTMGQHHARVYNELSETELVGVVDQDRRQVIDVATEYDTAAMRVRELLDVADVVSIAVPTEKHYDVAARCIDRSVDLLIEKPIAKSVRRGRQLVRAAEEAGVTLQIGHIERFNPAIQTLDDVAQNLDIIAIEAKRLGPEPDREIVDTAVLDLMIHDIDLVTSLVNADVETLCATGTAEGRHATATIDFEDAVVGTLTASRVTQEKIRKVTIAAEDCFVVADCIDQSVRIHRQSVPEYVTKDGDVHYRHESIVENPAVNRGEPLKHELRSFAETVETGREPAVSGADGIRALELARKIDDRAFGSQDGSHGVRRRAADD